MQQIVKDKILIPVVIIVRTVFPDVTSVGSGTNPKFVWPTPDEAMFDSY